MDDIEQLLSYVRTQNLSFLNQHFEATKVSVFFIRNDQNNSVFKLMVEKDWVAGIHALLSCEYVTKAMVMSHKLSDIWRVVRSQAMDNILHAYIFDRAANSRPRYALFICNTTYEHMGELENKERTVMQALNEALCGHFRDMVPPDRKNGYFNLPSDNFRDNLNFGNYCKSNSHSSINETWEALKEFRSVHLDCSSTKQYNLIQNFLDFLNRDRTATGLIVFSGHGFSENHKQYLVPVDYELEQEASQYCICVQDVLKRMSTGRPDAVKLIFTDCCRSQGNYADEESPTNADEPSEMTMAATNENYDYTSNALIAYAVSPNQQSFGRFFSTLLNCIKMPIDVQDMLKVVQIEMRRAQIEAGIYVAEVSWIESSLLSKFSFTNKLYDK